MWNKSVFEKELKAVFDDFVEDSFLKQTMAYSLFADGKRFRPLLLLNVYDQMSKEEDAVSSEIAVLFAASIECIHTYSLIHDDLPCMDDDDMRRGKPSSHKAFGEAEALIAGDALLNLAFEIMSDAVVRDGGNFSAKAMAFIAKNTGARGMVLGQSLDIQENGALGIEEIERINSLKTAALIQAAVCGGAILAGADEEFVSKSERLGAYIGQLFQLTDDLLDVDNESADGKTYPVVLGEKKTKLKIETLNKEAQNLADEIGLFVLKDSIANIVNRTY